jgi:hypothetical protein
MRAVGFLCHLETILLQTGVGPSMRYKVLWQEGRLSTPPLTRVGRTCRGRLCGPLGTALHVIAVDSTGCMLPSPQQTRSRTLLPAWLLAFDDFCHLAQNLL